MIVNILIHTQSIRPTFVHECSYISSIRIEAQLTLCLDTKPRYFPSFHNEGNMVMNFLIHIQGIRPTFVHECTYIYSIGIEVPIFNLHHQLQIKNPQNNPRVIYINPFYLIKEILETSEIQDHVSQGKLFVLPEPLPSDKTST